MYIRLWSYQKSLYSRLITVDFSRPKELDADLNAIQQVEFAGKLKNVHGINTDRVESKFILTILEKTKKNKKNEINIFSRKRNNIIKDGKLSRSES